MTLTSFLIPLTSGLITGASLIIAIGAQNAFVLRQGLTRKHVLAIVVVCALSDVVLICAGVAGVGAVVTAAPLVMTVVRWAGAAFLLGYAALAIRRAIKPQALISNPPEENSEQLLAGGRNVGLDRSQPPGLRVAIFTALALTWLNPHVYLDTVVLLGSLASRYGNDGRWIFALGASLASILWFSALGFGARFLGPIFAKPLAWRILDGTIAIVMMTLAVTLLLG